MTGDRLLARVRSDIGSCVAFGDYQPAVDAGLRALAAYGSDQSRLTLSHVGVSSKFPKVEIDEGGAQRPKSCLLPTTAKRA